jgi:hypothetical protein
LIVVTVIPTPGRSRLGALSSTYEDRLGKPDLENVALHPAPSRKDGTSAMIGGDA